MHIAEDLYYKLIGYIASAFGALLGVSWILVRYIFKRHVAENDKCLESLRADFRRECERINDRIDKLYEKD